MAERFMVDTKYASVFGVVPAALAAIVDVVLAKGVVLLAEIDGHVVAMVGALVVVSPMNGEDYVDEVVWWVEPEHRAGRIGPRLLAQLERWAIAKSVNVVKMVAPTPSMVGRFLEHRGYSAVETSYIKRLR